MSETSLSTEEQESVVALALKVLAKRNQRGEAITSPADTKRYLQLKIGELEHEVFGVIWLDNRHRILADEILFTGTINGASVYPREVVKRAMQVNAAAVLLYHCHPSGDPEPSRTDEVITNRLKEALTFVEVRVLDHVIVASADTTSFAERGLL
ncbi:MAG: DNA repair protein RadC [Thiotrichales bacterium SG8_50]|nr:MAG: DNA repair protein RadC [Thiotrichales bacterium SG8_50]